MVAVVVVVVVTTVAAAVVVDKFDEQRSAAHAKRQLHVLPMESTDKHTQIEPHGHRSGRTLWKSIGHSLARYLVAPYDVLLMVYFQ